MSSSMNPEYSRLVPPVEHGSYHTSPFLPQTEHSDIQAHVPQPHSPSTPLYNARRRTIAIVLSILAATAAFAFMITQPRTSKPPSARPFTLPAASSVRPRWGIVGPGRISHVRAALSSVLHNYKRDHFIGLRCSSKNLRVHHHSSGCRCERLLRTNL
jgi:hypothetical protein